VGGGILGKAGWQCEKMSQEKPTLSFEELHTLLVEIEGTLNN